MNILITSAGRRVSLVRSFQKELKKFFPESKVFASDSTPKLSAACQIADHYFEVPRLNEDLYFEEFISLCQQHNIKLIIPTIDTELLQLAQNKVRLEEKGVSVVISSIDFITKCRDKRSIHSFFETKGLRVAKEYGKDNYSLPMFIKPYDGSRSVDTYVINKKSELTDYHFENEKLMFLEYLDHNEFTEFTCDLYYDKNNKLKCAVPRKRLEVRDGEVYKALTQNNILVKYIRQHLLHIDGAVGCITAQFFLHNNDESKIYAIEINPRFGGGFPLSYLAGANFPKWIIEEYLLENNIEDKFNSWESDLLMIRYDDEILVHGYKG
ncbi:ATP-grasp domain-containing protein [Winogradskyella luteola]|uniref:ATP-grasp domain-containing protein n=1 Tax=Winogradskyella luteola TaxID=2828330 RepID=A0A9X1F697_9FLAO|nr:ATP-grasp domain-containing protein [Winogradskyella luteola]MBV7268155.1 ATP-grasp domain-containing protein [Winogradskyella luteola]